MGSNPGTVCWMDMTFFHVDLFQKCIGCLKRPKINEKEAGVGLEEKKLDFTKFGHTGYTDCLNRLLFGEQNRYY